MVEILFHTRCSLVVTSPDCSHIGGIGAEWVDVGSMGEEDASALAGMTDPRDVWRGVGMLPLALKQVRKKTKLLFFSPVGGCEVIGYGSCKL